MKTHLSLRLLLILNCFYSFNCYSAPHENAYDNNDRCGNAGKREFERKWVDGTPSNQGSLTYATNYKTHYNAALNKCFMLVKIITSNTKKSAASNNSVVLIDVYEGVEFGSYGERSGKFIGKSRGAFTCVVNQTKCASKEEFDQQVKIYMEN